MPRPPRHLLARLTLLAMILGTARASDLSKEISPLVKPDFEAARVVVRNLDQLAASQSGNEKVRTQRLATAIRNLFTAEFRVGEALAAARDAEREAQKYEQTARNWLKPNAFGRTNPQAAEEARNKAAAVRKRAAERTAAERRELARHAREVEVVMRNFHDLGDLEIVIRLGEALAAVTSRSLDKEPYTPAFTPAALATMKLAAAKGDEWRQAARAAEQANLPEQALRLHAMAGDLAAARAAANALVPELVEAGLHGSAIDALEIAGDSREADQLRAAHPDLPAAAFRKLDPEDLAWRLTAACVRVTNGSTRAAGYFCGRDGLVLTVQGALADRDKPVVVHLADQRTFTAQLVAAPAGAELALVRIPLGRHLALFTGRNADLQPGAEVSLTAIAPAPAGSPAQGRVADTTGLADSPPTVLVNLGQHHAAAGTPLLDDRGRVLAILRAAHPADTPPPAAAIPAGALAAFLREHAKGGFSF